MTQITSYMSRISADVQSASRSSHGMSAHADILYGGSKVSTVRLTTGSVAVDRTATNCRSGTCIVGDPTFAPTFVNSPLAPYGVELAIYSDLVFDSGLQVSIPLGVFPLEEADCEDSTGNLPQLQLYDRSRGIQRANFRGPLQNIAGWSARNLITRLVHEVYRGVSVTFDPALGATDSILPGGTTYDTGDGSRWTTIQTLCALIGAEGRFAWDGNFYVVPIPTLIGVSSPSPVWEFAAGETGYRNLVQALRGMSRTGCYNFVYVTGSSSVSGPTPVGWAFDNDPRSPTFWGLTFDNGDTLHGSPTPFGPSVLPLQNDALLTNAACTAYAQQQLSNVLGIARSLSFTAVPMPALDAGDIVKVTYDSGQYEYHLLDSFAVPLGVDTTFTGTTRTQTYQLTGGT